MHNMHLGMHTKLWSILYELASLSENRYRRLCINYVDTSMLIKTRLTSVTPIMQIHAIFSH